MGRGLEQKNAAISGRRRGGANPEPGGGRAAPAAARSSVACWYLGTMVPYPDVKEITRTQTGVRLETRLLKVLKALATELDMTLGDLIEGIVLHAFEGKAPFSAGTLKKVKALKAVYGLDLTAKDSHQLREAGDDAS
jgi:hypothetical protein